MQSTIVVVVGAGVAGLAAARSLGAAGVRVVVVEKEDRIGGMAAKYACKGTDRCNKCNVCLAREITRDVQGQPGVRILAGAQVESVQPTPGGYGLEAGGSEVECSAVVLATGFEPFDASSRPEFRYGASPAVVTALDLEKALRDGSRLEDALGRKASSVAFVQCFGSRNPKVGRGYCSRVCCMYSLRMAKVVKHRSQATDVTMFYMDFQGGGKDPAAFRRIAETEDGIRLVRAMPGDIGLADGDRAIVRYEDMDTGRCRASEFDLVVLAVGTCPGPDSPALARTFGVELDEFGFLRPVDLDGAASAPASNVFVAGACRGPKDIAESVADGERAALAVLRALAARRAEATVRSVLVGGAWPTRRALSKLPETIEVASGVLVLGGGIAGMEAARAASDLGCRAIIVERGPCLGGQGGVSPVLRSVDRDGSIDVLTGSRLVALQGQAGNFTARVRGPGALDSEISAGAVIVATGCGRELPEPCRGLLGHRSLVGLSDLGRSSPPWAAGAAGSRRDAGSAGRAVIWVGVRPETARALFRQALYAALSAREAGWEAYVLFPEASVATSNDEGLYLEARRAGVVFVRYQDEPEVKVEEGAVLRVTVEDPSLGGLAADGGPETLAVDADVLVAAEEAYPQPDTGELARILQINTGPVGFFQDDNVNLLPVLTNRQGIFAIGGCRGAFDTTEAMSDARLAAGLAARLLAGGKLEVDWATAQVDSEKCALCLTCVRTCPHKAIDLDSEARAAKVARAACWGCGVCAAECPGKAITLEQYSDDEILSQVAPSVTAFCCDHSSLLAAQESLARRPSSLVGLNIVAVPCTGKVDVIHLLRAIERGADAVLVAACFDEGCHYLTGNARARKRVAQVASALASAGIEPERVRFYHIGPDMSEAFAKAAQETMDAARELGPVTRRRIG